MGNASNLNLGEEVSAWSMKNVAVADSAAVLVCFCNFDRWAWSNSSGASGGVMGNTYERYDECILLSINAAYLKCLQVLPSFISR